MIRTRGQKTMRPRFVCLWLVLASLCGGNGRLAYDRFGEVAELVAEQLRVGRRAKAGAEAVIVTDRRTPSGMPLNRLAATDRLSPGSMKPVMRQFSTRPEDPRNGS